MYSEIALNNPCDSVISLVNAGKTYRRYRQPSDRLWQYFSTGGQQRYTDFTALEGVSLELRRGEVIGIVGVNGAGKSTLLQLVTGIIEPSNGTVVTRGRVAAILELGSGFNPDFTGRENIFLNAATLGLSRSEVESRVDAIIEFAGIGAHIDQPVKTYSSGMVVRLAFSIATSVDADILIIDEALSVGDGAFRRKSFNRIMEIKNRGATILFCSHVAFHVETFCDRALWLHRGRVQMLGPTSDVLRPYEEFLDLFEKNSDASPDQAITASSASKLTVDKPATRQTVAPEMRTASPHLDARIVSVVVAVGGVTGTEFSAVSGLSDFDCVISYVSDPSLPSPTAALVFSTDSGKVLASTLSATRSLSLSRNEAGEGSARIRLETIPLNKGRYRVGVYLFCENGMHGYDMVDPVAHLNMSHTGVEQGQFLIAGTWSALPGLQAQ